MGIKSMDRILIMKTKREKRDIATNIDLEIEKMIREEIKKDYPQRRIFGEEFGKSGDAGKNGFVWIIDPIDGTKYYSAGVKFFSVSIALWRDKEPVLGVICVPGFDEVYFAEKGTGAFCNNKKIKVSGINSLKDSIVCVDMTTKERKMNSQEYKLITEKFGELLKNANRVRALGAGAIALSWLAKGAWEAYIDLSGQESILDIGAGLIIAKEAGAKISGLDGKFHGENVNNIVVTNGKIHDELLRLLNSKK